MNSVLFTLDCNSFCPGPFAVSTDIPFTLDVTRNVLPWLALLEHRDRIEISHVHLVFQGREE